MTIYETIKAAISVKQAAEHYGLKANRNGMACCPFHNDRHPSLKLNEDYFFGCGAKGDVIDLVARLFDLSSYEAAQRLAADFGLDPKAPTAAVLPKPKHLLVPHVDILGLNYGTPRYEEDIARDPNRLYCGSETMSHGIVDNWEIVKKHHQIIGDFVWTGWDYLGEAGTCGAWDYPEWGGLGLFDGAGTVDATGYKTASNYYMQIEYGTYTRPYIAVKPVSYTGHTYFKGAWRMTNAIHSWSWNGFEGTKAEVEVYGIGKYAELFINGKSIGKKKLKKKKAIFKTAYQPGTLAAKVYKSDGTLWGEDSLQTAGNETRLRVWAEKTTLKADGQDLCYINIELTDNNGELKPAADITVHVKVEGEAAELAALGSARTRTAEVFGSSHHLTHFGRAQAILRSGTAAGKVTVTVSCEGCEDETIDIVVE